ncbi:UPF0182 family protein [Galbitalea sp. SE-J8]|uniref:UPF0182 family membrane protein n=1 Tax=Galbitalea sp. SE-J8 TaxID=3054952 RepID=UPI00259D1362|nr:UPF0182 family protein [Galbitalea sp. SE-J8]MDM4763521.1 UPF0182 family protein [Galbitalea sp. SE-J8]
MSTPAAAPRNRTRIALTITAVVLAALVVLLFIGSGLYTEVLWYDQLHFLSVLTTQWAGIAILFVIGFLAMAVPVFVSIEIAYRARPVYAKLNQQLDRYQQVIEPLRRLATFGVPIVLGIFAGVSTASRWTVVAQWLNRTPFGDADPQFGLDSSFYVFELPFYRGVAAFASAVVLVAGLATIATAYLYGAVRIAGREVRISKAARIHLATLAAVYLAVQAVSIWLDQYTSIIDASQGYLSTGAGYTEAHATIPGRAILAGIAAFVAILFIVTAVIGRWRLPVIGTALLLVSGLVVGSIYPFVLQRFMVDPSARSLEADYIQRNIDGTREAYGVADVQEQDYSAVTDAEPGALRADANTTASIRILDPSLVSDSFRQLQRFKQYYTFEQHLDVDRYTINGATQDTVLAVRELDQSGLGDAQTWYNDALVYTHGYGVVAAYGNQRASDGQPAFLESNIPVSGELGDYEPRVYFGESSPAYSIVGGAKGSTPIELDYPSGDNDDSQNAKTTFDGDGGPKLDNVFTKLAYAIKFSSEQILLSDAVTNDSQILYDRDPRDRVQKVAPYLTLDSDPYPAIVNGRIQWIVDGYTTTASYPYSTTEDLSDAIADTQTEPGTSVLDQINYIRNSVKATVDAYDGSVTLYAWDAKDPLLKTWEKIYPGTIKPASDMSTELLAHVRYPADLFKVQRAVLGSYHVTDPESFYSGDDQWVTPPDPTGSAAAPTLQPPYYLTMQVPGTDSPAFTLYSTYIPKSSANSSSNVLTGYLAVDSDAGKDYGKLTLLTLPKQKTVPGPGQVQNQFKSDTAVSSYINTLSIGGNTTPKYGNLLTLPVGGGLLYVQPVYVQSTGETSYPLLRKILVGFGNKVAFEDTLDAALNSLFGGESGTDVPDSGDGTDDGGGPAEGGGGPTDGGTNPALQLALADANAALHDREAAYAKNDLVAAAQADQRLQDAIARALAADGTDTPAPTSPAPSPTPTDSADG